GAFHHPPCEEWSYPVLDPVSQAYPRVQGRLPTCYSPVRHSSTHASAGFSVRLACVKHAASVRPEPGSNSPTMQRKINPSQKHTTTTNHNSQPWPRASSKKPQKTGAKQQNKTYKAHC